MDPRDKPYEGPRVMPADEADRLNREYAASQSMRHGTVDRDPLAVMVEQEAVRKMREALAEAGLLHDEWAEAAKVRWAAVNDATDRIALAFVSRQEAKLEQIIDAAVRLCWEHPDQFLAAAAQLARRKPWAFAKALVRTFQED